MSNKSHRTAAPAPSPGQTSQTGKVALRGPHRSAWWLGYLALSCSLLATTTSQAQFTLPGSPPACDPTLQSCAPTPAPAPAPGAGQSCSTSAAGGTCGAPSPAALGSPAGLNNGAGNPINITNGNKYQMEVALPALPGELGLEIVRHYNSSARRVVGSLGLGWRLSYESDLYVVGNTIQILQADGARLIFNQVQLARLMGRSTGRR